MVVADVGQYGWFQRLTRPWLGWRRVFNSFRSGVTEDRITKRLTPFLEIAACNSFRLWVETEMFRGGEKGDRLRGVVGPMRSMMCSMTRVEEACFEFEMENVDVGKDRLKNLGGGRSDFPLTELIVI